MHKLYVSGARCYYGLEDYTQGVGAYTKVLDRFFVSAGVARISVSPEPARGCRAFYKAVATMPLAHALTIAASSRSPEKSAKRYKIENANNRRAALGAAAWPLSSCTA
jgi:hypothetical protein